MNDRIEQLTNHIQEHCLWQFFSRTWDREENIEGILGCAAEILAGDPVPAETLADKAYFADAKILVADFKRLYPWISGLPKEELRQLFQGVKERMKAIAVTGSRNQELKDPNY